MAGVRLEGVSKVFGNITAVAKMDLDIKDGEFLVLVGPSGCGKTTTLRMVAGLETPTEGEIYIGERRVTHLEPKDRDIAMVFQNYALYPHMKVYDNMAFGLRLRRVPREEIDRRVKEAAEMLGIAGLLDRYPKELSGGQRQRVALGRAIVRHPQVFLMDEPLSNLDAKLRVQTRAELIKLHQRLKTTVIYVTHDQVEAMTMGTRIVVMKDGVVQQVGTPQEIYNRPGNMFVAGFIGSPPMNFIKGILEQVDGKLFFKGKGITFNLSFVKLGELPDNKEIILGVRPEHLTLHQEESTTASVAFGYYIPCIVEVVEHIGAEAIIHAKTRGGEELVIRYTGENKIPKMGEMIKVRPQGNLHLFEMASSQCILSEKWDFPTHN
ncbi:carbohydrate ABC transporter ATP-binding protein, CUT1 family [Thermanaeromonas toyohensis ToBE]|uniref:Carbohydrate ABC transporter ATP-binding protein, CUT1 family n=1 Tax=Thermanaeromonas toyohensis ToBE TaxID=698762 RepID=A0A1W1VWL9_9FIRM|nr:sn-glycerol-3-phosphate ABC transporter ATP-binding protein UgpC [Thermanaeromonas toyohensis]SMB97284.1 carbohydrate ABC transporter ATP-binding protein, CUT1 family [Thermanaeromonas toyohensis ToBE]